jgi:hypothetical protein
MPNPDIMPLHFKLLPDYLEPKTSLAVKADRTCFMGVYARFGLVDDRYKLGTSLEVPVRACETS